jgi:hypothetical protein
MAHRFPGPTDPSHIHEKIDDGTLARQTSPRPGPIIYVFGHPSWVDQTILNPLPYESQEEWFEARISKLLNRCAEVFVTEINKWARENPREVLYTGETPRFNVFPNGMVRLRGETLSREEFPAPEQGDYQAAVTLGRYSIDFSTPVVIDRTSGKGFKWIGQMYIDDVIGAHRWWEQVLTPERRMWRGRWEIEVDATDPDKPQWKMISPP